ncbi:hypothetical protein F4859DRAFT_456169 [Xylaria cf. heliscus]|nr:hypothetical protein F4859DRAFT_456169 [Xylaria cf. heliscus]
MLLSLLQLRIQRRARAALLLLVPRIADGVLLDQLFNGFRCLLPLLRGIVTPRWYSGSCTCIVCTLGEYIFCRSATAHPRMISSNI